MHPTYFHQLCLSPLPPWTGKLSYLGGTIVMLVVAFARHEPLPTVAMDGRSHGMSWAGGIFGAAYIGISILLVPRLGAATVITLLVAGQMIGSLVFDHFGFFGLLVHHVTARRAIGAVLLPAGAILVRY